MCSDTMELQNRVQDEVKTGQALRKGLLAIIMLGFKTLRSRQTVDTLSRRMTELANLRADWDNYIVSKPLAVTGLLASPTYMLNKYDKLMSALADRIVLELSRINCAFCLTGNVLATGLCEARNIGSGYEATQQLPSRSAPRNTQSHFDYDKYKWVSTVSWGLADTLVQGKHSMKNGPHQGSDAPLNEGLAQMSQQVAELVLERKTTRDRRVIRALRTVATYE
jgi:hypothetical protein